MAELLREQLYLSSAIQLLKNNYLVMMVVMQADIEEAIDDMNRDASSTDHEIPALILKECKSNVSYPVFLIWKESFESEVIPEE